jgi:hypothetical protein
MPMTQIAHIEFHDARVARISVMPAGIVRVDLKHVCVYVKVEEALFEVWSARAVLQLEDVSNIEMRGAFQTEDYVSEGALFDETGAEMSGELTPDRLTQATRLELLFAGSGAEARLSMRMASFVLEELLEKLEDWKGPLISKA